MRTGRSGSSASFIRQGSPAKVALPDGWLDDPDEDVIPAGAEIMHSGG